MANRIIEEHVHTDGGGGGALTALTIVLVVVVLLVVLYFFGMFGRLFGSSKHEIDIEIKKPGLALPMLTIRDTNPYGQW
ncbi:MAG TPA: hypothetical protein VFV34_01240 [Blastocatellia bacterium]|nr:hypothetical protein [Blastocatellia bacterium]